MAKAPTKEEPFAFTSDVIVHRNSQTMGANATTEIGESIETPGVADSILGGMYIHAIYSGFAPLAQTGMHYAPVSTSCFTTQIQVGNRSAAPATEDPTSIWLFASTTWVANLTTSGAMQSVYPAPVRIMRVEPVIVLESFTVVHHGSNNAVHNDEVMHTEIWYQTCLIHETVHSRILRNQARTS